MTHYVTLRKYIIIIKNFLLFDNILYKKICPMSKKNMSNEQKKYVQWAKKICPMGKVNYLI